MKTKFLLLLILFAYPLFGISQTNTMSGFSSTSGYLNKLEVIATTNVDKFIRFRYGGNAPQGFAGIQFSSYNNYSWFNYAGETGELIFSQATGNPTFKGDLGSPIFVMNRYGNIGIGVLNPSNRLEVNGTIRAKEIKLEASNWPDYVFDENYSLMPLDEVSAFIRENGHLPGLKPADAYYKEGVGILELNQQLLEKVEELTLYAIQQEEKLKRLDELEKEMEILKLMIKGKL